MDLKLKDVAELLNLSETTVRRWLAEGKIPAYRLNRQYRFSRIEIEDWVMSQKLGKIKRNEEENEIEDEPEVESKSNRQIGIQQYSLYRAVNKGGVYQVKGETKEEIIRETANLLADRFNWDAELIAELLIDRERLMPTSLNNGIGVPHARDCLLNNHFDAIAVVFPPSPIEYGALDGQPVHTLFFLFACEDKRHLHLLAKLAHLSSQPQSVDFLKSRPSQEELLDYIKNWEIEDRK